jgi:hypothetical protein
LEKAREGTALLTRPFHVEQFDFSDQGYTESIFA